jgi:hypothetical protein
MILLIMYNYEITLVYTYIHHLTTCIAHSRWSNTCGSLWTAAVGSQKHIRAVKPTVQLVGKNLVYMRNVKGHTFR